jgi:hypothetical protein
LLAHSDIPYSIVKIFPAKKFPTSEKLSTSSVLLTGTSKTYYSASENRDIELILTLKSTGSYYSGTFPAVFPRSRVPSALPSALPWNATTIALPRNDSQSSALPRNALQELQQSELISGMRVLGPKPVCKHGFGDPEGGDGIVRDGMVRATPLFRQRDGSERDGSATPNLRISRTFGTGWFENPKDRTTPNPRRFAATPTDARTHPDSKKATTGTLAEKPPTGTLAEKPPTGTLAEKPPTGTLAEKPPTGTLAEKPPTGTLALKSPTGTLAANLNHGQNFQRAAA